ncbi:MAG: tRNA (N6-isopentenyl adenosine(37)-C2)-methylthiotransferase MiaB [Bacilli bacterium]|nr:tRNA (N6-isopentenyl adenosine(37)-C2)-methylthiotransferase MiaB [Bacilli bacterium]
MAKIKIIQKPCQKDAAKRPEVERVLANREVPEILKTFAKGRYFYIRTYGCQGNVRDEEVMAGFLSEAGFTRTYEQSKADVAVINTCAVRENAEDKIYGEIGAFKANKVRNKDFILILAGCVMGEDGVGENLIKTYPFISLVIGTHDVHKINELITDYLKEHQSIINVHSFSSEVVEQLPSVRLNDTEAFVNISYGCDKFCTYCIVPFTRGRERSRHPDDVVAECQKLVDDGYKQITLLGQNVNSYGLDLKDGTNFATLLARVAETGISRLKFLTSYPSQFNDEMIETMAKYPNIDHWLHFPVQSGSTSCLKRMGRRYTREEYLERAKKIKEMIPDMSLSTDIIVGFPGETEEEFLDTLSLAKEVGYSSAFTFIYSPRPGTPAATMEQVPPEVSHERFNRLKALVDDLTAKHSDEMIGKTFEVLVEGTSKRDENVLSGYARNGKLVNFVGPAYLTGCLVNVRILESHVYSLKGEMVEDPLVVKARDVAFHMKHDKLLREYSRLSEEIANDEEIKSLGEELVEAKKELALSMGQESHKEKKAHYEEILNKINNHPLLLNRDALHEAVEGELLAIRDILK